MTKQQSSLNNLPTMSDKEPSDSNFDEDVDLEDVPPPPAEEDVDEEAPPAVSSSSLKDSGSHDGTADDDESYDDERSSQDGTVDADRELQDRRVHIIAYGMFLLGSALYLAAKATDLPYYQHYDGVPKMIRESNSEQYWWAYYRAKNLVPQEMLESGDPDEWYAWYNSTFYYRKQLFMVPNADQKYNDPDNETEAWVSQFMALYFSAAVCWIITAILLAIAARGNLKIVILYNVMLLAAIFGVLSSMFVNKDKDLSLSMNAVSVHLFFVISIALIVRHIRQTVHYVVQRFRQTHDAAQPDTCCRLPLAAWLLMGDVAFFGGTLGDVILSWLYLSDQDYLAQANGAVATSILWLLASLVYLAVSFFDLRLMKQYIADGCPRTETSRAAPRMVIAPEASEAIVRSSPKKRKTTSKQSKKRAPPAIPDDEESADSAASQSNFNRNLLIVIGICIILIAVVLGVVLGTKDSGDSTPARTYTYPPTPTPVSGNNDGASAGNADAGTSASDGSDNDTVFDNCVMEQSTFSDTTVKVTLAVSPDISHEEVQYAADIFAKTYGGSSMSGEFCDPSCRQITDVMLEESIATFSLVENGNPVERQAGGEVCDMQVKMILTVGGTYYGCPAEPFPGLFSENEASDTKTFPADAECQVCEAGSMGATDVDLLFVMKRYLTILGNICDVTDIEIEEGA